MIEPSRFLPFLSDFSSFFPIFPSFSRFLAFFFRCQGWHSAPLAPSGYATVFVQGTIQRLLNLGIEYCNVSLSDVVSEHRKLSSQPVIVVWRNFSILSPELVLA